MTNPSKRHQGIRSRISRFATGLFSIVFPVTKGRKTYTGAEEMSKLTKLEGALSGVAKKLLNQGEAKSEFKLRERELWPYAPFAFGRAVISIERIDGANAILTVRPTTRSMIFRVCNSIFYLIVIKLAANEEISNSKAVGLFLGILLLANLSARVLDPVIYFERVNRFLEKHTDKMDLG